MPDIFTFFVRPRPFFAVVAVISALSLGAAFVAQYVFGLAPCVLCIYQRWPFAVAIGLAGAGYLGWKKARITIAAAGLLALTFAVNAALAFYHSGVERKWWISIFEGCSAPDLSGSPEELMARIMNTPAARCDEIPWADPLLGLSMANYNVALCAGLVLLCLIFLARRHKFTSA